MKKIFIILGSAFALFTFVMLGIYAFAVNDWGLDIDESNLFPSFTLTALDHKIDYNRYYSYYGDDINKFKIINKTDDDITVYVNSNFYTEQNGDYEFFIDTYGNYTVEVSGKKVSILPVTDDYQYVFSSSGIFSSGDDRNMRVELSESYDNEDYVEPDSTDETITIKAGDSYEVKLPE